MLEAGISLWRKISVQECLDAPVARKVAKERKKGKKRERERDRERERERERERKRQRQRQRYPHPPGLPGKWCLHYHQQVHT